MAEKRRGLGRGLGALIPSGPSGADRPVDVFFPGSASTVTSESPSVDPSLEATGSHAEAGTTEGNGTQDTSEAARARGSLLREDLVTGPAPAAPADPSSAADPDLHHVDDRSVPSPADPAGSGDAGSAAAEVDQVPVAADGDAQENGTAGGGSRHTSRATDVPPAAEDDGTSLVPVPGAHFAEIPVGEIQPNPRQPRTVFDEDALAELVSSIREIGVLQPVVVRPVSGDGAVRYELIMGERRWRATQQAGLGTIPAIVRETEDHDLLRDALLENLHRSQLNALEEAAAYQQLLDDFGCTHEELAARIHRSRPQISNTLRLLRLPPLVQRRVAAGVLSAGHARALLGLPDAAAMERLAQRIVAEGLSVRATEEIVTLGGDPERPAPVRRPRAGGRNAALDDLATRLSDRFDTRVKIALGKSKGRLTVEFASVDDLNRILATLSPDDPGLLR
jgi:ParB family transcriptional regulator, chromosome partitioning protein